jgi:hypothetical protein
VVDSESSVDTILSLAAEIIGWLDYCFNNGPVPPETPRIATAEFGSLLIFQVTAPQGAIPIRQVDLFVATQMDSTVPTACDVATIPLFRFGTNYFGFLPIGTPMRCGPPVRPDNLVYYASARTGGSPRSARRCTTGRRRWNSAATSRHASSIFTATTSPCRLRRPVCARQPRPGVCADRNVAPRIQHAEAKRDDVRLFVMFLDDYHALHHFLRIHLAVPMRPSFSGVLAN